MQPHCNISVSSITSLILNFPVVGFSGSRNPTYQAGSSVSFFLPYLSCYSGTIGVGCANGVDDIVRSYFPQSRVFKVQPPINRKAFALRSTRLVKWVHSSKGLLVAFPFSASPKSVVPSTTFHGYGSGTWGSIALAIGIGSPVLVFVHSPSGSTFSAPQILASHFVLLGFCLGGYWWLAY
ncbi:MAG: hypothetical protein QM503_03190 [Bacteroidota bacterium]